MSRPSRAVALVAALVVLAFLGISRSLWTPDEPREAEIAREMALRPEIIPTLGGKPFIEKPPLYYWVVAAAYRATGQVTPAVARSVSAVSGLLTLLVLYLWASRAVSRAAAAAAVLMLATSVQFLISTHWILIDPLLMLECAVAVWAAWEVVERGGGARFRLALDAALVAALWTKGLVGPVLVGAGLALFLWVDRDRRPWTRLRPARVLGVLALALVVLVAALWMAGGAGALREWAWTNHVRRLLSPAGTGHREPPYYYVAPLLVAALPWLVPFAALLGRRFWRADAAHGRLRRYAGALVVAGLGVLSLSATKRETYLLPLLPPLFLLMALAVEERRAGGRIGDGIQAGLCVALALVPGVAVVVWSGTLGAGAAVAIAAALVAGVALFRTVARRKRAATALLAAGAAAAFAASALLVLAPAIEGAKDFRPFLAALAARLPPGARVDTIGADETLVAVVPFYTGRRIREIAPGERPEQVVVQIKERVNPGAGPPAGYRVVASQHFGENRRLLLCEREAPNPAGVVPAIDVPASAGR